MSPGEDRPPKEATSLYWTLIGEGTVRTTRMLDGKEEVVGVAGRTLREVWGEREDRMLIAEEFTELEVDDVDEALE